MRKRTKIKIKKYIKEYLLYFFFFVSILYFFNSKLLMKTRVPNNQYYKLKKDYDNLFSKLDSIYRIKNSLLISYPKQKIKDNGKYILIGLTEFEANIYSYSFYQLAKKYKIDWEIIASLVWVESRFNPTLESSKNCKGLTQLKENTAKAQAKKMGIPFLKKVLWHDLNNLEIGINYFCDVSFDNKYYEYMAKRYVGGPKFYKYKLQKTKEYIEYYKNLIMNEYNKLKYIYKGTTL